MDPKEDDGEEEPLHWMAELAAGNVGTTGGRDDCVAQPLEDEDLSEEVLVAPAGAHAEAAQEVDATSGDDLAVALDVPPVPLAVPLAHGDVADGGRAEEGDLDLDRGTSVGGQVFGVAERLLRLRSSSTGEEVKAETGMRACAVRLAKLMARANTRGLGRPPNPRTRQATA